MTEHVVEHERVYALLMGVQGTPIEFAGEALASLVAWMHEHMAREEDAFLRGEGREAESPGPPQALRVHALRPLASEFSPF